MDVRNLPTHPGTGLTAIGLRANGDPIWPILGAAEDDSAGEGDDGDEGDGEEEEPDDGDEGESEWEPPSKDAWEAAQAKLKRANEQAKRLREQLKEAGVQSGPVKAAAKKAAPAKKTAAPAAEETEDIAAGADSGELERWQVRAIRADAKSALLEAGCDPDLIDAPLSRLKPGEIDWDGDDPILDEYVEEMMERYPKAFAKQPAPVKAAPRKAGSIDQGATANGGVAQPQRPFGEALLRRGGWGSERRHGVAGRRNG